MRLVYSKAASDTVHKVQVLYCKWESTLCKSTEESPTRPVNPGSNDDGPPSDRHN